MIIALISLLLLLSSSLLSGQDLNDRVMEIANSYEGGGYKWSSTGVPKSLFFKNTKILSKSAYGTFCSGYTFLVAYEVMTEKKMLDRFDLATVKKLQRDWYGTDEASAESQCLMALEKLNLGREISHSDAKAGDFVQFWRNNKSGHSVIFLDWIKGANGAIIGVKYRSTQRKTNGIGDRTESIGTGDSDINIERLYIVRLKG